MKVIRRKYIVWYNIKLKKKIFRFHVMQVKYVPTWGATDIVLLITAQKMKFFIKNLFSKRDQIRSFLRIWSHLLKKSLMENFIFCAVYIMHFFSVTKAFLCHIIHKNLFQTYENCISFKILGIHLSKMCPMHFFDLSLLNSFLAALCKVFFSIFIKPFDAFDWWLDPLI